MTIGQATKVFKINDLSTIPLTKKKLILKIVYFMKYTRNCH